jgi:hypothetical protein
MDTYRRPLQTKQISDPGDVLNQQFMIACCKAVTKIKSIFGALCGVNVMAAEMNHTTGDIERFYEAQSETSIPFKPGKFYIVHTLNDRAMAGRIIEMFRDLMIRTGGDGFIYVNDCSDRSGKTWAMVDANSIRIAYYYCG